MKRFLVVVAAVTAIFMISGCRAKAGGRGAVHTVAPDFSLQTLDGTTLSLANYHGKVVLLDFWATWCTPCRAEIPHFIEYQNQYGPRGFQVLGVSMDDDAKPVRDFYNEFKMNYPVALGNTKLADSYGGVLGLPVTFIIDREGKIAAKYVGAADMAAVQKQIASLVESK